MIWWDIYEFGGIYLNFNQSKRMCLKMCVASIPIVHLLNV